MPTNSRIASTFDTPPLSQSLTLLQLFNFLFHGAFLDEFGERFKLVDTERDSLFARQGLAILFVHLLEVDRLLVAVDIKFG